MRQEKGLNEQCPTYHVEEALQFVVHVELGEASVRIKANVCDAFEVHRHPYLILAVG